MKIGKFVRRHVPAIFEYCETHDPAEFSRLQDPVVSKEIFDINYPFCLPVARIGQTDRVRFWSEEYVVCGIPVRVTSQWFNPPTSKSLPLLRRYLRVRGITFDERQVDTSELTSVEDTPRAARGRYKGNAIGNAQNLLVRNVLSRLGDEQFSALQWEAVIADFGGCCAYCGTNGEVVMDHVVPINKQALGEHRLGNLVPACRACNAKKAGQDVRAFLAHDPHRLAAIVAHMATHGYAPIGENEQIRQLIELAHQDVRQLADRYVAIINTILQDSSDNAQI